MVSHTHAYTCDCCSSRHEDEREPLPATHVMRMLEEYRNDHLDDFELQVEGCFFMCAECLADDEWAEAGMSINFGDAEPIINGQLPTGEVPRPNPPRERWAY
jgi:hypothetical protein